MMTTAKSDDSAEVQKMKLVTRGDSLGNIADKAFQRTTATKHPHEHVARIDLRQPAGRQFQHVVSGVVRQHTHNDNVTSARRTIRTGNIQSPRKTQW